MASSTHTSLPKPFASGNVREWLTRFDICGDANGWDEKVRAVKLPTLLEGECGGLGTQWREACHAARSGHPPGNRNVISGLCYSGGRPSRQHPAWRRRASLSVNAPKG